MIQIEIGDTVVIILEPDNLDRLRDGRMLKLPGGFVGSPRKLVLDYTPDVPWVTEQVTVLFHGRDPSTIDPSEVQGIIEASKKRPEVHNRPAHPTLNPLEKLTPQ